MMALQEKLASFKRSASAAAHTNGTTVHRPSGAWQRLIDEKLIEWGRRPEQFDEEGFKPPVADVLAEACEFAAYCRDIDLEPPLRVAPDGSGGVVFEWRYDPFFHTVEMHANGDAEMLIFENGKLLVRQPIG